MHDVVPDPFGGCRGEGVERRSWEIGAEATQLAIFGTEVVSPLADAVCFVDRDETHAALAQHAPEALAAFADQTFGRDVQKAATVLSQARNHLIALRRALRAVEKG